MSLIRVSRGIPQYNIQIGPQKDALKYNPTAILSVTDDFDQSLMQYPICRWLPINEIAKSWGYLPFFATKKILDFWCLDMGYPLVYLCCSAGKHRSPMVGFCWLMSNMPNAKPEEIAVEFFGDFRRDNETIDQMYLSDVKHGYIPEDLPAFYEAMCENPGASYRTLTQGMLLYERISYSEDRTVIF
jgi:hypothetical protein